MVKEILAVSLQEFHISGAFCRSRVEFPGGSVSKCAKELGISRPTARKWMPEKMKLERLQAEKDRLQEQLPAEPSKQEQIAEILKQPGKVKQIIKVLKS